MDREVALIKQDLENLKNEVNSLADKVTAFEPKPKPRKKKE